jgi:hypothetical protein
MNRKLNILTLISRKALRITFALLIALSFSAGGVLANSCQGGTDCIYCAAAAHSHIPGIDMEMVNQGCQSAEQNSSCGLEAGSSADDFYRMAALVKSGTQPYSGIFAVASGESDQTHLYREFITQFQYPARGELTPIYLLNLSLLC